MPKRLNAPKPEETFQLFETEEPFKAIAKRLGISPNTLRGWWVGHFGQEAFEVRGRALQTKGAVSFNVGRTGQAHEVREVAAFCSTCGAEVKLNAIQQVRMKVVLCHGCEGAARGVDRHCPVCGVGCVGEKGLASHMVRPYQGGAPAHAAFLQAQEASRWVEKAEGQDFVVCRLCGVKDTTLGRHLKADHELTAVAYREQFPGARIVCENILQTRSDSVTSIFLTEAQLAPYRLGNGKVVLSRAVDGLGYDPSTIRRSCNRLGLPLFTRLGKQTVCLDTISKVLGGALCYQEHRFRKFANPLTGHMFHFDGYFPDHDLLCEFQGYQHWTFPNFYHKDDLAAYDAMVERDRQKALQVRASGEFKFLTVREDEPYGDPAYLRGRLIDEGVLDPPR